MSTRTNGPSGLGGWLVLVIIGLLFSLVRIPWTILSIHVKLILDGTLATLMDPQSSAYHPLWLPLIIFEVAGNLLIFGLAIITLVLLFNRSRFTPGLAISVYATNVGVIALDILASRLIPSLAAQPVDSGSLMDLAKGIFVALIWIPYFLVSTRVRNTFVVDWPRLPGRAKAAPPALPRSDEGVSAEV